MIKWLRKKEMGFKDHVLFGISPPFSTKSHKTYLNCSHGVVWATEQYPTTQSKAIVQAVWHDDKLFKHIFVPSGFLRYLGSVTISYNPKPNQLHNVFDAIIKTFQTSNDIQRSTHHLQTGLAVEDSWLSVCRCNQLVMSPQTTEICFSSISSCYHETYLSIPNTNRLNYHVSWSGLKQRIWEPCA